MTHEPDAAALVSATERVRIVLDVACQLGQFRYLGSQHSAVVVGHDSHGAVGVVWRATEEALTRVEWEQAAADARRLGYGPRLTLISTGNIAPLEPGWRFIQTRKLDDRWTVAQVLDADEQA